MFSDQSNHDRQRHTGSDDHHSHDDDGVGYAHDQSVDFDKYVRSSNYDDVFHDLGQGHNNLKSPMIDGQGGSGGQGHHSNGANHVTDDQQVPQPYIQTAEDIVQAVMEDFSLDQSLHSSEGEEVSDIEEGYDHFQQTTNAAATSRFHDSKALQRARQQQSDDVSGPDSSRPPPVMGKSIFTQEELSNNPQQSLAEFEKLEAALEHNTSENEAVDQQLGVIGAYLKGQCAQLICIMLIGDLITTLCFPCR